MKGIFAPTGSYIPGTDMTLKASKIRGEESNGMLCSFRELQLGDDHSGIIDLPAEARTGAPAAEPLGPDDPLIEIKVTPNHSDRPAVHAIAPHLPPPHPPPPPPAHPALHPLTPPPPT